MTWNGAMGPGVADLERRLLEQAEDVRGFFEAQRAAVGSSLYTSVDVRESLHKVASVDANAFPGGFNNLDAPSRALAAQALGRRIREALPQARTLAVVAEAHTRNPPYLRNIEALCGILEDAGFEAIPVAPVQGSPLMPGFAAASRAGAHLVVRGRRPDVVVSNHDLMEGVPDLLQDLVQPVLPDPALGWHQRRKRHHMEALDRLTQEFGRRLGIDPWLLGTLHRAIPDVGFVGKRNLDAAAQAADEMLDELRQRHEEHRIPEAPWLMAKSDPGTYGTGVVAIRRGRDLLAMGTRVRQRLERSKGGVEVTALVLQEGVPTVVMGPGGGHAELVAYLGGGQWLGSFWRVHADKDHSENLNRPGSSFLHHLPQDAQRPQATYRVAALLADLAVAHEAKALVTATAPAAAPLGPP